jgi:hypothetical protein
VAAVLAGIVGVVGVVEVTGSMPSVSWSEVSMTVAA